MVRSLLLVAAAFGILIYAWAECRPVAPGPVEQDTLLLEEAAPRDGTAWSELRSPRRPR